MTQPHNYCAKAITDLMALTASPTAPLGCQMGAKFLANLLRRAEVFVLPDGGELMDRGKPRPEVPAATFKPSFPVVALEYSSSSTRYFDPQTQTRCSRRIALAWEWDGLSPGGPLPDAHIAPGEAVAIASICYFDEQQVWLPVTSAVIIGYDAPYVDGEPSSRLLQILGEARFASRQCKSKNLALQDMLMILPEAFFKMTNQLGPEAAHELILADLLDEINSYADLCLALACNNVRAERHAQPAKLNKARVKRGDLPLKDFHVLKIAGSEDGEGFGGAAHSGVRSHLRRGHIRRLGPERITWVNATMVRGSRRGFVEKHYSVPPITGAPSV